MLEIRLADNAGLAVTAAAIVGRVVGTRDITLREVDNPYSDKKSVLGYAGYRVAVDWICRRQRGSGGVAD